MAASWSLWLLLLALARSGQESQAQDCGMAPLNTKIQGGGNAAAGSWPWQVSVHQNNGAAPPPYVCGGTLISREWVLTAANCIQSNQQYTVFLGRQTQQGPNSNQVTRGVSRAIVHPDFNTPFMGNDMALLQLSSTVDFNNFIRPICLAGGGSVFPASISCYMTGWGKLMLNDTNISNQLQQVLVPFVSQQQCQRQFPANTSVTITSSMICAGEEGRGICTGDSGGPLQCQQNGRWIQAGIVSFGDICAQGIPDVYTRVSSFVPWITSQVGASAQSGVGFETFNVNTPPVTAINNPTASGVQHLTLLYLLLLPLLTLLS